MIWIEIVTIGGEILSGRTADTNFSFLARGLLAHGLACRWHTSVPDEREPLAEALENALSRADVVITTGGLGATPDDITRKLLATVLKRQLILREDLLAAIQERYERLGRKAPANLQAQALVPFGADLIENQIGLAPGLRMRTPDNRVLYALPGVPPEMERMAERFVLPEIASLAPSVRRHERVVRTIGIPETVLSEMLASLIPPEVRVAYLPHLGMVELRLTAEGELREVQPLLDRIVAILRSRLGAALYAEGEGTLEEAMGMALIGRGWRVAIAESLTGGSVGAKIVRVPGASRYFVGDVVAYDNEVKTDLLGVPEPWIRDHGAVSAPVAEAMAAGVREKLGAEVGVSTTGIAGPDGGSAEKPVGLVFIGLAWPQDRAAFRRQMPGDRMMVIERTSNIALDFVRRVAAGLPLEG
jgi:nicotinamide-nucleotide amidase